MTPARAFTLLLLLSFLSSCIGDDIIFDAVDENLRISASIDTLGVGDTYQFEAIYTNNIGQEESVSITWSSSDETVLQIDQDGLATGIAAGQADVSATFNGTDNTLTETYRLQVADNTVVSTPQARTL